LLFNFRSGIGSLLKIRNFKLKNPQVFKRPQKYHKNNHRSKPQNEEKFAHIRVLDIKKIFDEQLYSLKN